MTTATAAAAAVDTKQTDIKKHIYYNQSNALQI
jgi:hypothetical protein